MEFDEHRESEPLPYELPPEAAELGAVAVPGQVEEPEGHDGVAAIGYDYNPADSELPQPPEEYSADPPEQVLAAESAETELSVTSPLDQWVFLPPQDEFEAPLPPSVELPAYNIDQFTEEPDEQAQAATTRLHQATVERLLEVHKDYGVVRVMAGGRISEQEIALQVPVEDGTIEVSVAKMITTETSGSATLTYTLQLEHATADEHHPLASVTSSSLSPVTLRRDIDTDMFYDELPNGLTEQQMTEELRERLAAVNRWSAELRDMGFVTHTPVGPQQMEYITSVLANAQPPVVAVQSLIASAVAEQAAVSHAESMLTADVFAQTVLAHQERHGSQPAITVNAETGMIAELAMGIMPTRSAYRAPLASVYLSQSVQNLPVQVRDSLPAAADTFHTTLTYSVQYQQFTVSSEFTVRDAQGKPVLPSVVSHRRVGGEALVRLRGAFRKPTIDHSR